MSNLEQAVILMNERWLNSICDAEDYVPGKKQLRAVKRIDERLRGGKYRRLTRRSVAALIAAAILLATLTAAMANETSRNYIIEKFRDHSVYSVQSTSETKVTPVELGYIPEGFENTYSFEGENQSVLEYQINDKYFSINKRLINTNTYIDTEESETEEITLNQTRYVLYKPNNKLLGIVWNDGTYNFCIEGNISKEELIKIATCTS